MKEQFGGDVEFAEDWLSDEQLSEETGTGPDDRPDPDGQRRLSISPD